MSDDDTLARLAQLKERVKQLNTKLAEAKVRKAVLQDRLAVLNEKLRKVAGHADWDKARIMLEALNNSASEALASLAEALDGIDF